MLFIADAIDQFRNNPLYLIKEGFIPEHEREIETLLAMCNGYLGTRDSLGEVTKFSDPGTYIAGLYENISGDQYNELVKAPNWTRQIIYIDDELIEISKTNIIYHLRYIDFTRCTISREWKVIDSIGRITSLKAEKFVSLHDKHQAGKSLYIRPENYCANIKVISGIDSGKVNDDKIEINSHIDYTSGIAMQMRVKSSNKAVFMGQSSNFYLDGTVINKEGLSYEAAVCHGDQALGIMVHEEWVWPAKIGQEYEIKTSVGIYTHADAQNADVKEVAKQYFSHSDDCSFDKSLDLHISSWNELFNNSRVYVEGSIKNQREINFSIYQLIISGQFSGINSSIPARTLSGSAYKGHVFWDTEIYLTPFYTYTNPEITKNLLMYRYNTLEGARHNANKEGFDGASYAWESTDNGYEMTPHFIFMPNGEVIRIFSGKAENHISMDIVYAIWKYYIATEDVDFLVNYGSEIIFETAKFVMSLTNKGKDGKYHIRSVIGPDEYHEVVDDNAYTNFLARFSLRVALKVKDLLISQYKCKYEELENKVNARENDFEEWQAVADNMYTGIDSNTCLIEQFKGFFDLIDVNLESYEPRTAPMDVVLGRDRTQASKVIKQPDALMALFLLDDVFKNNEIKVNFDYYDPKTSHGSSLSPSIHSILAAKCGYSELAYKYFVQNTEIDLSNIMGNASGGIHIAAQGGVWMSIVFGFSGLTVFEEGLVFSPLLPPQWTSLAYNLHWKNQKLVIDITVDSFKVVNKGNTAVNLSLEKDNGIKWRNIEPGIEYYAIKKDKWLWS